jgi:hypothetical protein
MNKDSSNKYCIDCYFCERTIPDTIYNRLICNNELSYRNEVTGFNDIKDRRCDKIRLYCRGMWFKPKNKEWSGSKEKQ